MDQFDQTIRCDICGRIAEIKSIRVDHSHRDWHEVPPGWKVADTLPGYDGLRFACSACVPSAPVQDPYRRALGPMEQPCDCGSPDAYWHGPEEGLRRYCCDPCWERESGMTEEPCEGSRVLGYVPEEKE